MATSAQTVPSPSRGGFPESARVHSRWNYAWHTLEGGLYMGGIAFVSTDTVLPNMVNSFGGPEWLIALTPLLTVAGVMGPQLFAAHWIERLTSVHGYTIRMGFFQRFPFFIGALGLLLLDNSFLALAVALAAPLLSGFFAGCGAPAWKELISRTVPPERRASLHGWRNTIGALIGLGAGGLIHVLLSIYPGSVGYGLLYATCFGFLMLSWYGFRQLKEIPLPDRANKEHSTLWDKLKKMPSLVRFDKQLRYMSISSLAGPSIFILVPFAAVYATEATSRGDSFTGLLVMAKTIGLFGGNFIGGYLGDKYGGRLNLIISCSLRLLFCALVPFVSSEFLFLALFALYGASFTIDMLGNQVLALEIAPDGKRPTYLGIISALTFPGILLVPVISTIIRQFSHAIWPLAVASIIGTVISLLALLAIKEPRLDPTAP